jgi:hypothetical protein
MLNSAAHINADTANTKGTSASINAANTKGSAASVNVDTANTKGSATSVKADTANTKGSASDEEDSWLILYSVKRGGAKGTRGDLCKNPPIDTIARKDPPEGLLNNPSMDVMALEDQSEEGVAVSVAAVAAAPNTTVYHAKYGSGHYCPAGDNEESSDDNSGEDKSLLSHNYIDEGEGGKRPSGVNEESPKDNGEGECLSLGFVLSHEDIDDNDYVDIDINSDSEDKMRSSFPNNLTRSSKLALGGPQARDTTGMMDSKKEAI